MDPSDWLRQLHRARWAEPAAAAERELFARGFTGDPRCDACGALLPSAYTFLRGHRLCVDCLRGLLAIIHGR